MGLPDDLALQVAMTRGMYTALNVTELATRYRINLMKAATVYFDVGSHFGLVWFRDQIAADNREGHWNNRARIALRDELDNLQRKLSLLIIQQGSKTANAQKLIHEWKTNNPSLHDRWGKMLETVHENPQPDFTLFFIALRELWGLIAESERTV
jgi:glutamate dehydrogenase